MAFWNRAPKDPAEAQRAQYRELLAQANRAPLPADKARLLNLAGDVALAGGDQKGAMSALGDALDLYLRDHQYHPARAVARKLLRVRENTVRVRSTLAWLAIAHDLPDDAKVAIDLYVSSLRLPGEQDFAVRHLTAMAGATRDRALRGAIAQHLAELGAAHAATGVRERLEAEEKGTQSQLSDTEIRANWKDALDKLVSPESPARR